MQLNEEICKEYHDDQNSHKCLHAQVDDESSCLETFF